MKVTAIIPDELIQNVKILTKGQTTTEAIIIALSEWIKSKEIQRLNVKLADQPLKFLPGFSGTKARQLSRRKR